MYIHIYIYIYIGSHIQAATKRATALLRPQSPEGKSTMSRKIKPVLLRARSRMFTMHKVAQLVPSGTWTRPSECYCTEQGRSLGGGALWRGKGIA